VPHHALFFSVSVPFFPFSFSLFCFPALPSSLGDTSGSATSYSLFSVYFLQPASQFFAPSTVPVLLLPLSLTSKKPNQNTVIFHVLSEFYMESKSVRW
jgi:hypothetical protein